jgi:hypothetical protein
MSNLGRLCHVKGGGALAYRKGGDALIFKGNPPGEVVIRIPWGPQSYVCDAVGVYHELQFSATVQIVAGAGSIVERSEGGTETVVKVRIYSAPATIEVLTSIVSPCSDGSQDPGVSCDVLATQRGAVPRSRRGVAAPRLSAGGEPTSVRIEVGADCRLSGVF